MTQKEAVLLWWRTHKYISSAESFSKLYIVDLQGVIRNLKDDGYKIGDKWKPVVNIYGEKTRYKKYFLVSK